MLSFKAVVCHIIKNDSSWMTDPDIFTIDKPNTVIHNATLVLYSLCIDFRAVGMKALQISSFMSLTQSPYKSLYGLPEKRQEMRSMLADEQLQFIPSTGYC